MKIQIGNVEREVTVEIESNGVLRCRVGKAIAYWKNGYNEPFIMIPGKTYDQVKPHRSLIIKFLMEYKRRVSQSQKPGGLSFVTEEEIERAESASKPREINEDYVSCVPKWLTELKEWKLCSGPKHTYMRRVRLPEEHREKAERYMPHCSVCQYRADCQTPCLSPELHSQEEILEGLCD